MSDLIRRKRTGEAWETVSAGDVDESSAPYEFLTGSAVSIGNGANALLPFDTHVEGSVLTDLSTPTVPTVIEAGIYAIMFTFFASALTAGGSYDYYAFMNGGAGDCWEDVATVRPPAAATLVFALPAGGTFGVSISNSDGVASRNFKIDQTSIQRIG